VTFTIIADVDTRTAPATPEAIHDEVLSLLLASKKKWRFTVYRPERARAVEK